jgi:hypothetical protein
MGLMGLHFYLGSSQIFSLLCKHAHKVLNTPWVLPNRSLVAMRRWPQDLKQPVNAYSRSTVYCRKTSMRDHSSWCRVPLLSLHNVQACKVIFTGNIYYLGTSLNLYNLHKKGHFLFYFPGSTFFPINIY